MISRCLCWVFLIGISKFCLRKIYTFDLHCLYVLFQLVSICTLLSYLKLVSHLFWLPLLDLFVFDKKGTKKKKFVFMFLPLCWWLTKRGRKILSYRVYICMLTFLHIWCFNWYLEACFILNISLVSRAPCLYALSFIAYLLFICLCMS